MKMDLKSLSRKELEKLLSDVKKALLTSQARDRREAKKAAQKAAAEFGFSLEELSDAKTTAKPKKTRKGKVKAKAQPRFANPADASQTWTGKGRQPAWYKDAIAAGKSQQDLAI